MCGKTSATAFCTLSFSFSFCFRSLLSTSLLTVKVTFSAVVGVCGAGSRWAEAIHNSLHLMSLPPIPSVTSLLFFFLLFSLFLLPLLTHFPFFATSSFILVLLRSLFRFYLAPFTLALSLIPCRTRSLIHQLFLYHFSKCFSFSSTCPSLACPVAS